jgi:V-type H+-transporting ATPase subunit C
LKIYEKEIELPGVVPNSDKYLDREDDDGNQLWRITVMADHATGYIRVMKKSGFQCQEFTFDSDQYTANKNLESQLKQELSQSNEKMYSKVKTNFQDLFQALVHLKIMRTYIDGVLRFGIPPEFLMGIIKPENTKAEEKIK